MNYRGSLTIPANTPVSAPVEQEMILGPGVMSRVRIAIPAGHHGLAHLRIYRWGHQLYPTTPDADYAGDDEVIEIEDNMPGDEPPYTLRLWGYNTSTQYDHTFEVSITLQSATGAGGVGGPLARLMEWVRG